jgi:ligand-binding sensor domain-containing protein
MKKVILLIFISLVGLGVTGTVFAQGGDIRFKHISLDEGLSQNSVYCIIQDSKGFMWFGTQDGLNKYDGYEFTVYKPEPGNPATLSDNHINCIYEDESGILWLGTDDGGLNAFDPKTETFNHYPVDTVTANPGRALRSPRVNSIVRDTGGDVWIGTNAGGLSRLMPEDETFKHYGHNDEEPAGLGSNRVSSILIDRSGILWVGTFDDGLKRYDPHTDSFQHFRARRNEPGSLSSNNVLRIYEDRSGVLWIGTAFGGLNYMDREKGKFFAYRHISGDPASLSSNEVNTICEDRSGVLWVGTRGHGLNRLDKRSGTFTRYLKDPNDPNTLRDNAILSIFEDGSRILWIGTFGGLNKFDREHKFDHYKVNPHDSNSLSGPYVFSVCEDSSGILWLGTRDNGLNRFDRKTGTYNHFRNISGDPRSLGSDFVASILEDRTGVLWVGCLGGGLNKLDRKSGTFTRYLRDPDDPTSPKSLGSDFTNALIEDHAGMIWITSYGGGLVKFNGETETFTHYRRQEGNSNSLSRNSAFTIYEAPSEPGVIWLGMDRSGLNRFDTKTGMVTRYLPNRDDPTAPDNPGGDAIAGIYEDRAGTLWLATLGGGLKKMTGRKSGSVSFAGFTEKDGLCNNTVYGILEDDDGCLWLSTNRGLSRFDPKNGTFKNYNARDGLQGNEFNSWSYFKSRSGEMFFGGISGLTAFHPSRITGNPHVPPVVITRFLLFNRAAPAGNPEEGGRSFPGGSITWAKEICLSHKENVFSFEFAALDFTVPENNRYAYMMEGFDEDWNYTGAQKRFAAYTNLDPGEYVFRVKGSNNDGTWNEQGASLKIIITPPYWETWWFRIILGVVVLGLLLMWYRRRLKNVRLKTELQTARDAQMSIMPRSNPQIEDFDISGICIPASEVGGDFFDYIWMNEEKTRLGIAIGDVSGKAMRSAMTAVMTSGMIYLKADESQSVKEIMKRVNRPLYFKTERKVFTALCLGSLDIPAKELTFTNAGLNEPLLKSGDSVSKLEGAGVKLPLGVKLDSEYLERKYQLKPGDIIVFFTDGVTEAKNPQLEFYGLRSLVTLLEGLSPTLTAEEIKKKIIADVRRFSDGAPQHDDITVVVVRVE